MGWASGSAPGSSRLALLRPDPALADLVETDLCWLEAEAARRVWADRSWLRIHAEAVHLYGHTHGTIPGTRHAEDVGLDAWGYAPVSLAEALTRIAGNALLEDELRLAAGRDHPGADADEDGRS